MIKKCLAVRHVAFEDLGLLGPLLAARGYDVHYLDAGVQPFDPETLIAPDLVIVLGGPIGVYERDAWNPGFNQWGFDFFGVWIPL